MITSKKKQVFLKKNPHWHYEYDLGDGIKTIPFSENINTWHEQRRQIIFGEITKYLGESLYGLSCLDVACNSGFWSFLLAERNANSVLGIDQSPYVIKQAKFLQECWEDRSSVHRIKFLHTDIFDLDEKAGFDLVLCLGLMYHLTDPVTVAKKLYKLAGNLLVVDSTTIVTSEKYLEIGDHNKHPSISKTEFAFIPSKSALIEIFRHAGFSKIHEYQCEDKNAGPYYLGTRTLLLMEK